MNLKTKVLVLGSTGMLGHQVVNYLSQFENFEVSDIAYRISLREETIIVDAMDKVRLEQVIILIKPDFIVNCIGVLVSGSRNEGKAIYLNAYLPNFLLELAISINSKLIHISTDCVFSGSMGGYIETDYKDGYGIYSQTKILGEYDDASHLILRTSFIGPELKKDGEGLFHWFMKQTGTINGFNNSVWSGVTTVELAKAIKWSIDENITGLYHVTNNNSITKHDLLKLFQKYTEKDIIIKINNNQPSNKTFRDTRLLLNYRIPSYEKMISNMVDSIADNSAQYSQYKVCVFDKK